MNCLLPSSVNTYNGGNIHGSSRASDDRRTIKKNYKIRIAYNIQNM